MRIPTTTLLVVLPLIAGGSAYAQSYGTGVPNHLAAQNHAVVLTSTEYAHLGAKTERARAVSYTPEIHGYGTVLSTTAFAQMDANIESAQAAVLQSGASLERNQHLRRAAKAVSLEALDAAVHQATADEVQLSLADRTEAAMFGAGAPWRGATRNTAMIAKIVAGDTAIVQATFPLDVRFGKMPASFTVMHLSEQKSAANAVSTVIWRAPSDPTIPGQSFYALVDSRDLEQGEHVIVHAPTGVALAGVLIPADAIVIAAQQSWCYVVDAPLTFRRVAVDMERPFGGGYFVTEGVKPNQLVLVKGTGLLLSREFGPSGPD
jgi:hypothetical protein